jgi:hypothetical protein
VLGELDVEAGVAHEVLQPDAGDRPRHRRRRRFRGWEIWGWIF